jgi:hypothetical protein
MNNVEHPEKFFFCKGCFSNAEKAAKAQLVSDSVLMKMKKSSNVPSCSTLTVVSKCDFSCQTEFSSLCDSTDLPSGNFILNVVIIGDSVLILVFSSWDKYKIVHTVQCHDTNSVTNRALNL